MFRESLRSVLNKVIPSNPNTDSPYEKLSKLDANVSSRAVPGSFSEVADENLAADGSYTIAADGIYCVIGAYDYIKVQYYSDAAGAWLEMDEGMFIGLSSNTRIHNTGDSSYAMVLRRFII